MPSKFTLRKTALILFALNIFLALWMHGGLAFLGLGAKDVSEPERLDMQVLPKAIMLDAPASQASASRESH